MTLDDLEKIISKRAQSDPSESWTAQLLSKGAEKCAEKFGEEAIELIIEVVKGDREKMISETADVVFHLLVMLHARGVRVEEVLSELEARQSQSGLEEKRQRKG
ncbi:MAG: phosphoribosyl-ATP diphosphatase [Paracoccaceae bacterium]